MKTKQLSVFFPTFNEEGNIETTVSKAVKILQDLHLEYEIIIVNDGSTDKTQSVAQKLASRNTKVKVINHPKNLGYGEALKSGFYNSKYDTIVYTDGDGQFDFGEITKFLNKIDECDLIVGFRIKRKDPFFRILFKEGWALSLLAFFRLSLKDIDCGFKMVKREVLQKIPHLKSQRGAMINAELVIKAKKAGFKIDQIGVVHYPRLSGKPTGANIVVIIKSYLDLLRLWWSLKKQKSAFILLFLILLLAAFFRFYRLPEYMNFLGDEGRDALIIKNMLVNQHFPLIGPPTSVGNIYLGPLYYYMMAFSMAIFWLNPVAAAAMNAVIGVATVGLIYYLGKIWFNKWAGLISAFLYAISPVTIIYSKSSWNPNPAPFFASLSILGLYRMHKTGNFMWVILTGLAVAASIQMHYLALILVPITSILWVIEVISRKKAHLKTKKVFTGTILGIFSFLIIMSPLLWFDLRHNFLNYLAITKLFSQGHAVGGNVINNLAKIPGIYAQDLIGRYIGGENFVLTLIVSALVLFSLKKKGWPILALAVWLFVGLLGLSFYSGSIYDHYLGFMNPVPFLLIGSLAKHFKRKWLTAGTVFLIVALSVVNLQKNPNLNPPNNQLKRTQEVAKFVITQSMNQDFNFALLSKNNYDAAYKFYLQQYGHDPKPVPAETTDQLFVVCEDQVCDPINNAKYEIAAFGWAKIATEESYNGVRVFKLVHNPSGKP